MTEARVSAGIINYNESKKGYNSMLSTIPQMETFKVSDKTSEILSKNSIITTKQSIKNRFKKKLLL